MAEKALAGSFIASDSALSVGPCQKSPRAAYLRFIASDSALSVGRLPRSRSRLRPRFIASDSALSVGPYNLPKVVLATVSSPLIRL